MRRKLVENPKSWFLTRLARDARGAAALEIAIWTTVIVVPVFSAVDIGVYTYRKMQVEAAAQAAVAAAWRFCDTGAELPAVQNCYTGAETLVVRMRRAAQNTSLGTNITLTNANITDGWYCRNGSGDLALQGSTATIGGSLSPTSAPTCPSSTTKAGEYIKATTTYTYTPIFSGLSVASLLGTSVSKTAWIRLR